MKDATGAKIEQRAILVESVFEGIFYAIDRQGKGMWIIVNGKEIPILAENVEEFGRELLEVWELYKREAG
jgi:helix-turn-helix protein